MNFKLKSLEKVISVPRIANVHFFEFPFDYRTVDDKHPFCELIFLAGGSLAVKSDEFTGEIKKNEFIIHPSNSVHSLSCPKKALSTVVIIGFECSSSKLSLFTKKPLHLDDAEIKQLSEIVKEGRNLFAPPYDQPIYDMKIKKDRAFGCEQMLGSLLEVFLIGLVRKYEFKETVAEKHDFGFEIDEIIKYVNANFLEKIKIDELAFLFQTNRSTLCKEFKSATGKTVVNYIIDKKIHLAKTLLLSTDLTLTQIADRTGFDSPPYFHSFFKKYAGITPLEFRKNK